MGAHARAALGEALKFAVLVGVVTYIETRLPDLNALWAEVLVSALAALISWFLILIVLGFALGRPAVNLEWLIGGSPAIGTYPQLRFVGGKTSDVVRINLDLKGKTALGWVVRKASGQLQLRLTIKFAPNEMVFLTPEKQPTGTYVADDHVAIDLYPDATLGPFRWLEFRVRSAVSDVQADQVKCHVDIISMRNVWLIHRLMRKGEGLDGFAIRRD